MNFMSTISIKYGKNKGIKQLNVDVIYLTEIKLKSISVISEFLKGTGSDKWLKEAEEKTWLK